jgi:CheY-like chemotaxis protein
MSAATPPVIADGTSTRSTIRAVFELDGYAVATAANGADGLLRLAGIRRPCMILFDPMMPIMDGW